MNEKNMKIQKLISVGILLLLSVAVLSAQDSLPNPHDDASGSSVAALRAWDLQAYNQFMDQAQRCNSYPEYQCLPAAEQPEQKISGKHSAKAVSKTANKTPDAAVSSPVVSDTNTQASASK
jgi:hypothetical protein